MLILFFLIMYTASLDGSIDGVRMYLGGIRKEKEAGVLEDTILTENADMSVSTRLANHEIWIDALTQVFFSLGTCMGIFVVYGSYRETKKYGIVSSAIIISVIDTLISFLSGFVVWSILGFLDKNGGRDGLRADELEGTGLVFVAIPNALDMVKGSGWWCFLVMVMFVCLGLTTSISFIEVVNTTINDISYLKGIPRQLIAIVICLTGFLCSMPFCMNWGFNLFDAVDHYMNSYLLVLVGSLQCMGCGWYFDLERTLDKSVEMKYSTMISILGFWLSLPIISFSVVFGSEEENRGWCILIFACV